MTASRLPWLLLTLGVLVVLLNQREAPPPAASAAADLPYLRALAPRRVAPVAAGNPFARLVAPTAVATPDSTQGQPGAGLPAPNLAPAPSWHAIGKQHDEQEGWAVFLARGEETRVVRNGDVLDDQWRVIAIQPPRLTLKHLGKRTRLTLDIGEAKE